VLPDFLRSSGPVTGSTQPRLGRNSSDSGLEAEDTTLGISHADHVGPSIHKKLTLTSLTSGSRSVGIVRLRTEAMGFFFVRIKVQ
jgi:predicted short-subunit dehydrogenase-like oxidoreductase (DUF2520 family)